ncbi:MAG: GatB/YqeY domain-containing protein [Sphingomonadaceae bacterium]|uniref:GatB/YqeY domain-containing protein n=1 Tax=Thermaurantiacus sp. TaxID=2820283 RepID=UPI00298F27AC|nr:GatB/YqeY domain-containing protein [Thermaurantiacus sp.]MCS6986776.1 GatB/YqeY domain-containing protein [Sphingomonadaceae bacterium]MDW8413961.1 GatB/YqeY domain-containing protein [Thermaurantiacus sp.]
MPIRDAVREALVAAMKARDRPRLDALRLIEAAIRNRDIEARTGPRPADDDALVLEVLRRLAKQRREAIDLYRQGGRCELAEREAFELELIEGFLPKPLDEAEARAAVATLVAEAGAQGPKDMGRVMGLVRERLGDRLDMATASRLVRELLA